MNKTAIKNFAIWARNKLIADIQYRAGLMGITAEGMKNALPQSTPNMEFYDIGTAEPYSITGEAIRQRQKLEEILRQKEKESDYSTAYKYILEEVAYTWFNRLIAIRFMEVNDYLPSHIRVLSSESGKVEPDLVTTPFDAELDFTPDEQETILRLKTDNALDGLFRLLFIKQCNALNEILPALFEKTSDYTEVLLNISVVDQEGVVYHLIHDIDEDDFNIERGGQVEIIGWLYQYYNTEPKAAAFAKNGKITKEEIPAVTQLFTPDWIVRYMVENSLGRLWVEGHLDCGLKENWKYYLEEAQQEPEVQAKLSEIRKEYAALNPEDIKLIDPCMGSGHILVYVVDWENDGFSLRNFKDESGRLRSVLRNTQFYFREAISWNDTTATGKIAFRYQTKEFIPNASGPCVYANKDLWYLFGLLNSKVSQVLLEILAPNMKFEVGQMGLVPIIMENRPEVEELSHNTVRIAKSDWDSFETSWDFKKHPLLRNVSTISEAFNQWQTECDDRFNQLKANEEELNRIFIDIYGLQDELTPEVEEKDVTVRKADLQRDIKSLLSYAVGCMFGRYSIYKDGLLFAGEPYSLQAFVNKLNDRPGTISADELERAYRNEGVVVDEMFFPDADNVIPITDEEYLDDDIVSRLCTWLKAVYGADTLETNLDYIAKALGNKSSTSREIIRNYFLNDFFKDHCQTYSVTGSGKRPIYWLFDSGKQNGFKALIYLHRYTPDTIGNLRVDYLHKMQRVYESEIGRMQDMIDHSTNSREVAVSTKRKEKLQKQLKECRDYDEMIAHLALSRIELDLDDGVKVNYRKIQTAADGKFYEVLADSKSIMAKEK